ncbi:preprotein translocase subunit SecY [Eubacterium ventriosum]|jgi:preprotein translocase subunit SecY|uniref:preprotein translocase subunit SecY n=1 Tax=Eubacterium ventriosum TaxID=39496 RepID=UPI0024324FA0|nr:preprotein translocase subunit SecY [Eubacterium ventriosum]
MLETLKKALKVKEIRKRLLYTFVMLIVVRLGCQIAIPFVNADMVAEVTSPFKEGGFSFLSAITGGSLENMSIFALNITPYITASIIMQLLTIAIPKLDELQKDGEEGRKKIAEITRYLTVALALIESTAMIIGFANQGIFNTDSISYGSMSSLRKWGVVLTGIIAMTAGSAVLMWIGEQITEKGVGNGISIVLTINIISGMPSDISNLFTTFVTGEGKSIGMRILSALIIIGVIVGIVVLVVILQAATRNIAVQMSQKVQGRRQVGGQQSNIPLKVNTAGVIPIIFASSLLQFPVVIASFFGKQPEWVNYLTQSHWCKPSQLKYSIGFVVYLLLVLFFAYFYTSITFNPREVAKNLNDRGGFIPGIRSGKPTVEYLTKILNYIIFIGAVGLIIVAVIPILASGLTGANVGFGGTSIIIIVGVILETLQTIKSMITERSYSTVKGIF